MNTEERQEILEEVLDEVEHFFYGYCGEDDYDSFQDRVHDMQAMADCANDPMVDHCIDVIYVISGNFDIDVDEEFRDEIESKLAELAADEI